MAVDPNAPSPNPPLPEGATRQTYERVSETVYEGDAVASDRDIQPLGRSSQRLSGLIFIGAAVIGILLFAYLQFADDDDVVIEDAQVFSPPPIDAQRLPEIQEAEVDPEPVLPEARDEGGLMFDPLEIERMRQRNALELERLKQAQAAFEAEQAEMLRRRRSDMLVVDDGEFSLGSAGGRADGLPTAAELFAGQQAASSAEETAAGFDDFGGGFGGETGSNQVYQNPQSRFLRDAGEMEVQQATALRLPNQDTLITQGTFISGILETAVNSDLPGMIRAVVDSPVYSRTGRVRLIPKGSRLVGMYQSGITRGQTRVFVVWTRLERPDGVVVDLGSPGSDSLGRSGLSGDVDNHFFQIYGASAFLSVLGPLAALAADDGDDGSGVRTEIIRGGADSFNRTAEIALEENLDIPPTITVDQGTPINVFVAKDLSFQNALRPGR